MAREGKDNDVTTEVQAELWWCGACQRLRKPSEHPPEHASEQQPFIVEGNWMLNPDTGEILEYMDQPIGPVERDFQFYVHDRASAEWVLEKLSEAEAEVAAIEKRKKTLLANLEAMGRPAGHRVTWLRRRFEDELKAWAEKELEGEKTRSIRTPFGQLAFRKVNERIKVDDEEAAIAWAKKHQPDAVKTTEKILVSELPVLLGFDPDEPAKAPPGCHLEPAHDSFTVKTGFEK